MFKNLVGKTLSHHPPLQNICLSLHNSREQQNRSVIKAQRNADQRDEYSAYEIDVIFIDLVFLSVRACDLSVIVLGDSLLSWQRKAGHISACNLCCKFMTINAQHHSSHHSHFNQDYNILHLLYIV